MSELSSIDAIIRCCEDAGAADPDRATQELNFIYGHAAEVKRQIEQLETELRQQQNFKYRANIRAEDAEAERDRLREECERLDRELYEAQQEKSHD